MGEWRLTVGSEEWDPLCVKTRTWGAHEIICKKHLVLLDTGESYKVLSLYILLCLYFSNSPIKLDSCTVYIGMRNEETEV